MPALAVKTLYGEMATIVTTGQRAVPARLTELGYELRARPSSRLTFATRPALGAAAIVGRSRAASLDGVLLGAQLGHGLAAAAERALRASSASPALAGQTSQMSTPTTPTAAGRTRPSFSP